MLDQVDFAKCIRANLKERRFGKERADEIIADFKQRSENYAAEGKTATDAALLAMNDTFDNMSRLTAEKAKRTAKMLEVQAANMDLIDAAAKTNMGVTAKKGEVKGDRGKAVAMAAVSLIEHDPRFAGLSYNGRKEVLRGQLFATMADVVDKAGKGAFGRQKAPAHLPNIVREIFGEETGDFAAKELAQGWLKTADLGVDLFNEAGGSMNKLAKYVPDPMTSIAKLNGAHVRTVKAAKSVLKEARKTEAFRKFKDIARNHWDWDKMRHPDGSRIRPDEYDAVIDAVFDTKASNGVNKLDEKAFRGQGKAVGNKIEENRFVHYKDAEGWLRAQEEFGEGSAFDVMVRHVEDMAHNVAMIETFGPNPELTKNNIGAIVKKKAKEFGNEATTKADAIMKNKFDPMFDIVSRANPMDPESISGNIGTGLANVLTSAQLGAASLLAVPGDFMQTIATRAANKQELFGGMDYYFKSIAGDGKFQQDIAMQSGFVIDDLITSTYATTRYTGINTVGPAVSRRVSDGVMRASFMSGHTRNARASVHKEFMGMLNRMKGDKFDDLPFAAMMERYGITAEDWDVFRAQKAWSPRKDVNFLRPIDILDTDVPNRAELFRKFQGMIIEEARTGVPEATIGAAVTLRGTERPDTLRGLLLHSFSMYKNFPVSFVSIYGRLGMASPTAKGRLSFYAGLGAGMTMVGALGVQMREVSKGRDPMPMDDPRFWGKSLMAGGAMSIWGDFLFAGVGRYGDGPEDIIGGPMAGFLGDTTNLVFGDAFRYIQSPDDFDFKLPENLVKWAKRYTPGTSVWWSRLALERQVWDRLEELADPKAYRKQQQRMRRQKKEFGNDHWWPSGDSSPERPPQYEGRN